MAEKTILFEDAQQALAVLGPQDRNLKLLENRFQVQAVSRGLTVRLHGRRSSEVARAATALRGFLEVVQGGNALTDEKVRIAVQGDPVDLADLEREVILVSPVHHRPIKPKTEGQKRYVQAMREHDIVFGVGPAGTGKTYLAVAMAVAAFNAKEVNRIILVRPAVEAGEKLGFLPGDLQAKVDPYLRPLYDALFEMLETEKHKRMLEQGIIEVAPLAYMRGRTLNEAFVILDEAQNTTPEQMKMFLTRLGYYSKAVITGDITQVDLPDHRVSGLIQVRRILEGVERIRFVSLTGGDVVRHELVQKIVDAYDRFENGGKGHPHQHR